MLISSIICEITNGIKNDNPQVLARNTSQALLHLLKILQLDIKSSSH